MSNFNWECPYCGSKQTVVRGTKWQHHLERFMMEDFVPKDLGLVATATACANDKCKKVTVHVTVGTLKLYGPNSWGLDTSKPQVRKRLLPPSKAKVQPDYIPKALKEDYEEACLIVDDSPKASATLARRCLQGMIRDFCGIAKGTLAEEIKALRAALDAGAQLAGVTHETVDAIDHVRGVGNIGAHMEKNIDKIIPVDPGEAELLIGLIEMLFDEWYVAKHNRGERLKAIAALSKKKKAAQAAPVPGSGASEDR